MKPNLKVKKACTRCGELIPAISGHPTCTRCRAEYRGCRFVQRDRFAEFPGLLDSSAFLPVPPVPLMAPADTQEDSAGEESKRIDWRYAARVVGNVTLGLAALSILYYVLGGR